MVKGMKDNYKKEFLMIGINLFLTLTIVFIVFGLWNKDMHVPICFQNDGLGAVATVKGMVEGEGIWHRSYWSAPFGESNYMVDYILPLFVIKIIILFTKDTAVVINVFWIMTYVFTAITTYMLLRKLNVRCSLAIFGSIIYNFLPYHYFRIEHFWLCGCYIIPLAIWLILDVMGMMEHKDERLFSIGKIYFTRNILINLVWCMLIGLNGIYYAVFTAMLVLIMGLFKSVSERNIKYIFRGGFYTIIIFVPIILFYVSPSLIWGNSQMGDTSAVRDVNDLERYALRIIALFFPVQGHRIKTFANFTEYYSNVFGLVNESFTVVLGLIMSIGLILSLLSLFCKNLFQNAAHFVNQVGKINIMILLISCQGGLAGFIGIFLTSAIRCFNRMSIFIALNSIIVVCILLEEFFEKRNIKNIVEMNIVSILLVLGILDQTSYQFKEYSLFNPSENKYQLTYGEKEKDYYNLKEYFSKIEEIVGVGETIYILPRNPYRGENNSPFVPIKGYVCSQSLKWSYSEYYRGYKKWFEKIEESDLQALLNSISLLDMSGIIVDKESYETEEEFEQTCMDLKRLTGEDAFIDSQGQLFFYDIANYKNQFLKQYSQDMIETLNEALRKEFDEVNVGIVDLESLYLTDSNLRENVVVKSEELQFGPYIDLKSGKYRVTVLGENLDTGNVMVTSKKGEKNISVHNLNAHKNVFEYEFELEEDEADVEFLMKGGGEEDILIEAYYYERDSGIGFHDLREYFEGVLYLENADIQLTFIDLMKKNLRIGENVYQQQEGKLILCSHEEQYGPYMELERGKYVVEIRGDNLKSAEVAVKYGWGKKWVETDIVKKDDTMLVYTFNLSEDVENIEIAMTNQGKSDVVINSYVCKSCREPEKQIKLLKKYAD